MDDEEKEIEEGGLKMDDELDIPPVEIDDGFGLDPEEDNYH